MNRIKQIFRLQLGEYKRRLSNSRPYHKIMDEREIRRLKTQVLSTRVRMLNGRPARRQVHLPSRSYSDPPRDYFATLALKDFENFASRRTSVDRDSLYVDGDDSVDSRFLAINTHRGMDENFRQQVSSRDISSSNLVQLSLRTLSGRSNSKRRAKERRSRYIEQKSIQTENYDEAFPSESFLSGSLWSGRNFVITIERLHEDIVALKADIIADAELATQNDCDAPHPEEELLAIVRRGLQDIVDITYGCVKRMRNHLKVLRFALYESFQISFRILRLWNLASR